MADSTPPLLDPSVGLAIRHNRLRAGMTQVQLARAISRSGKFLSEVENGKARITRQDLERLADAMGISCDKVMETDPADVERLAWGVPRRIRDVQPTGITITSFSQLLSHLDRSGWLRNAKLWMVSDLPFPEENDLALVEQIAALFAAKNISVRYVFAAARLDDVHREQLRDNQATLDALPTCLLDALRWSAAMRRFIDPTSDRIVGYAADWPLPDLCKSHTLLWVETEDVSWSDVMPLLYCRCVTRTFENPNETVAFWYHLPREIGSKLLLEIAQKLKTITNRRG